MRCEQSLLDRTHLTVYDAAYVALAEALNVALLTGDGRLAKSTGPQWAIEVIKTTKLTRRRPQGLT